MRYEVTVSRVLHEMLTVEATDAATALELAKTYADRGEAVTVFPSVCGYGVVAHSMIGPVEFGAVSQLDVTVESVEISDSREVVVCEGGLVRPRLLADQ